MLSTEKLANGFRQCVAFREEDLKMWRRANERYDSQIGQRLECSMYARSLKSCPACQFTRVDWRSGACQGSQDSNICLGAQDGVERHPDGALRLAGWSHEESADEVMLRIGYIGSL